MKDLWNWFSGKKTIIALFYNTVTWPAIMIIFDNSPSPLMVKTNMILGLLLSFVGLGHKIYKSKKS